MVFEDVEAWGIRAGEPKQPKDPCHLRAGKGLEISWPALSGCIGETEAWRSKSVPEQRTQLRPRV